MRRQGEVGLARALSKLGLASRTGARALISAGRVAVDGAIVRNPDTPVVPERVRIAIDGRTRARPAPLTILLHKPRGVVTTRSDPEGRPTVYDLLDGITAHVGPVGRLDAATSGLLLLTNDTRLGEWLTNPAHAVPRVYLVTVRGRLTAETAARLEHGVVDRGERLRASRVTVRKASARETHLVVELTEGRNREIRRLLAAVGHEVARLRRVQFGGLTLGRLAPGAWRALDAGEIGRAFPGYLEGRSPYQPRRDRVGLDRHAHLDGLALGDVVHRPGRYHGRRDHG
ncbi:MAG: pseudouridine synthase [Acidobacteriota bacterium]